MKNKMYKVEFSFNEFINLFKKKKCKFCGEKLVKIKSYNNLGYGKDRLGFVKFKGEITQIQYKYKCEKCNKTFDLKDL